MSKKTPEEELKIISASDMKRVNDIRRKNPLYFDKIIRDKYGPPPSNKNKKKPPKSMRSPPEGGTPALPSGRDKKGKVTKYILNKGGVVKKKKT